MGSRNKRLKMIKEHLNTLLILAARAQKAGLIDLNEIDAVAQAVNAAKAEIEKQQAPVIEDVKTDKK